MIPQEAADMLSRQFQDAARLLFNSSNEELPSHSQYRAIRVAEHPKSPPKEPKTQGIGLDEGDPFWEAYLKDAVRFDKTQAARWNQDLDALLVFVSFLLFLIQILWQSCLHVPTLGR